MPTIARMMSELLGAYHFVQNFVKHRPKGDAAQIANEYYDAFHKISWAKQGRDQQDELVKNFQMATEQRSRVDESDEESMTKRSIVVPGVSEGSASVSPPASKQRAEIDSSPASKL